MQYFALTGHSSSTLTLCSPMNIMVSPSPWGLQLILIRKLFYLCCTLELLCENNKLEGWRGLGHGFETSLWEHKRKKGKPAFYDYLHHHWEAPFQGFVFEKYLSCSAELSPGFSAGEGLSKSSVTIYSALLDKELVN